MQNKKNDVITTPFCDENGRDIDPLSILGKRCYATAAIKFEGIFIGARISLQVKVYEAKIKLIDSAPKRFLQSQMSSSQVVYDEKSPEPRQQTVVSMESQVEESESESDSETGSISGDNDDKPQVPVQQVVQSAPKAPVRRTINRKA